MKKIMIKVGVLTLVFTFFAQFSVAQTAQKKRLVNELVNVTIAAFPTDFIDSSVEKMGTLGAEGIKKELGAAVLEKIENSDLTAERKISAKQAVPDFTEKLGEKFKEIMKENLTMNDWIRESLSVNYYKQFTVAELRQLVAFFKSLSGNDFLVLVKEFASAEIEKRPPQKDGLVKKSSEVQIEKFMKTPAGQKFMNKFTDDDDKILEKRIDEWGAKMLKKVEEDMESGEMNKMLMDFRRQHLLMN